MGIHPVFDFYFFHSPIVRPSFTAVDLRKPIPIYDEPIG